jgi:hypothetical protein
MNPIINEYRKKMSTWFKKVMEPSPITVNIVPELIETKASDIPDDQVRYVTPRLLRMFW